MRNVVVWSLVTIISLNVWLDAGLKIITGADDDATTIVTTSLPNVTTNVCDDVNHQTISDYRFRWHLCLVTSIMWAVLLNEWRILFLSFYCRWVDLIPDNQSRCVSTSIWYRIFKVNFIQRRCFTESTILCHVCILFRF